MLATVIAAAAGGGAWWWFGRSHDGSGGTGGGGPKVIGPQTAAPSGDGNAPPGSRQWPVVLPEHAGLPVHVGRTIYYGAPDGVLVALDDQLGTQRWRYALSGPGVPPVPGPDVLVELRTSVSEPVVLGDTVLFTVDLRSPTGLASSHRVVSLHGATGREQWRRSVIGPVSVTAASTLCLLLEKASDSVMRDVLRALDPVSGRQAWAFSRAGRRIDQVFPRDGQALTVHLDNPETIVGLDEDSGALVWTREQKGNPRSTTFHRTQQSVLLRDFMTEDPNAPDTNTTVRLTGINPASGTEMWQRVLRNADQQPEVSAGKVLYFQGEGRLHAMDPVSGSVRWTFPMSYSKGRLWRFHAADGLVVARDPSNDRSSADVNAGRGKDSSSSLLKVLSERSGAVIGQFQVTGWPAELLEGDGTLLFIRSADELLVAVDAHSGRTMWTKKVPGLHSAEVQQRFLLVYGTSIDLVDRFTGKTPAAQ